jgi:hypothetical protein
MVQERKIALLVDAENVSHHYANRLKQPRDKQSEHIIQKLHEIGTRLCNCTLEQQEVLTIKPTTPQKA